MALVALGTRTGRDTASYGDGPGAALAAWADFPVEARPRPVVVLGSDVLLPEDPDGDEIWDRPWYRHRWVIPEALSTPDVRPGGRRLSDPYAAFSKLVALEPGRETDPRPLGLGVKFGHERFLTDRGETELPVWRFQLPQGSEGVVVALDPRDVVVSEGGFGEATNERFTYAEDRIIYRFEGPRPGSGPCDVRYVTRVRESDTAVALAIESRAGPDNSARRGQGWTCGANEAEPQEIRVHLDRPLGNRVVVGYHDGRAIVVRPEGAPR